MATGENMGRLASGRDNRNRHVPRSHIKNLASRAVEFVHRNRMGICHVAAAVVTTLVAWFFILPQIDRTPPFQVLSSSIQPFTIAPGGAVSVVYEINRLNADCDGKIVRSFVDSKGLVHTADPVAAAYNKDARRGGGYARFARSFKVPEGMALGPAEYHAQATYWCNAFQRLFPVEVEIPPIKFNVAQ